MISIIIFTLLLVYLAYVLFIAGPTYEAIDGDSLRFDSRVLRLADIDAPELGQYCYKESEIWDCGQLAKYVLEIFTESQNFHCVPLEEQDDFYGSELVRCYADEFGDVNESMVYLGMAMASFTNTYKFQEQVAMQLKLGIWSGTIQHHTPYEFRRRAK